MMDKETENKIFCFQDMTEKQKEALNSLGINQIIQEYMLSNEKLGDQTECFNEVASCDFLKGIFFDSMNTIFNKHVCIECIFGWFSRIYMKILVFSGHSSIVLKEMANLNKLFNDVIGSRKTYLEMHWANPGLFAQVVSIIIRMPIRVTWTVFFLSGYCNIQSSNWK